MGFYRLGQVYIRGDRSVLSERFSTSLRKKARLGTINIWSVDMNEIENYIKQFPEEVQKRLTAIRKIVHELAPLATERICMRMPTFDLNGGWLVHFAGFQKHIGFYPQPDGVAAFQDRLAGYKTSKGSIQFPLDKPLPLDLIREMIQFRVEAQS
jgi:uncharacterized protein YdhG (YjbR/CyaY superfamily)